MKNLKVVTGFLILPIFTALFFLDRAVLFFCPWLTAKPIQKWIYNAQDATNSLIRVIVALSIYGLFELIF
jgi:hypothetical protein